MERIDKCILAKSLGFIYNEETGDITTPTGKICIKTTKNGYRLLTLRDQNKNCYYLYGHQFAWYFKYNEVIEFIDHINGIKTDNKILNLRSVTKSQNAMNMKNVNGFSFCKRSKKWIAYIMVNYKRTYLGSFDNKDDAINCYKFNKEKYHKVNN